MPQPKEPAGFNAFEAPRKPAPDKIHAEPITVQINGKEYRLGRIRLSDIAAASARLRAIRLRALADAQPQMAWRVAAAAFAQAACIDPTNDDIFAFLENTAEGGAFLLWRVLSREHPGLTEQQAAELMEAEPTLLPMLFLSSELQRPKIESEGEQGARPTRPADDLPIFRPPEAQWTGQETPPSSPDTMDGHSMKSETSNGPST